MAGKPLILDIKGNSLDDGPGIRSVVFFKGCPLNCAWCHNPESKRAGVELSWERDKCVGCGACVEVCPESAISTENPDFIDRDRCTLCLVCPETCPSTALTRVGRDMTVDEVVKEAARYAPFYKTSGGGVTLSGGEPTLFMDFAAHLAEKLRALDIHVLLETCGWFDPDRFESLLMPHVDTIYMDLKLMDGREHRRHCGVDNEPILKNFIRLHRLAQAGAFQLLPRTPLIPGITDTEDNIRALAGFYEAHGVKKAALLGNNPIWFDKCRHLGLSPGFDPDHPIRNMYDLEKKREIKDLFPQQGHRGPIVLSVKGLKNPARRGCYPPARRFGQVCKLGGYLGVLPCRGRQHS